MMRLLLQLMCITMSNMNQNLLVGVADILGSSGAQTGVISDMYII